MPRHLTRAEKRRNADFLERLRLSGNAALAAREVGLPIGTLKSRRRRDPVLAQGWAAALAAAHARFHLAGGARGPGANAQTRSSRVKTRGAGQPSSQPPLVSTRDEGHPAQPKRTQGGEPVVTRTARGKLQLRLARPGRLTTEARQAFLRALAATANVRLSAAAAGATHATFYHHRRRDEAFRREWRLALQEGYDRLQLQLLQRLDPACGLDDAWRETEPAPTLPLTADQALQLLHLHQKEAKLGWSERRRRRGETHEQRGMRLFLLWRAEQRNEDQARALERAYRWARDRDWRLPGEPERPPELPPLDQVTGWSKADPAKTPHHEGVPMFGGWRIGDVRRRTGEG